MRKYPKPNSVIIDDLSIEAWFVYTRVAKAVCTML